MDVYGLIISASQARYDSLTTSNMISGIRGMNHDVGLARFVCYKVGIVQGSYNNTNSK